MCSHKILFLFIKGCTRNTTVIVYTAVFIYFSLTNDINNLFKLLNNMNNICKNDYFHNL